MKALSILGFLLLFAGVNKYLSARELSGAWQRMTDSTTLVRTISEGYFMEATFNTGDHKFFSARVGVSLTFQIQLQEPQWFHNGKSSK